MDRRAFLFGALRSRPDEGGSGMPDPQSGACGLAAPGTVVRIGGWRDFPIGESRLLEPYGIRVESLPEGLRARSPDPDGICYAISADGSGTLGVDRSVEWDSGMVYSIMVAGPVRLEPPLEEKYERG